MTHVVAGIIIKNNPQSYLLVSSKKDFGKYSGFYYPPAGHIEKGENELSALGREIKEELDLNIINAKKIAETVGDVKNQITSWYICDVDSYSFIENKKELQDAGFFTQQEMRSMKIWPATMSIFEKFIFEEEKIYQGSIILFYKKLNGELLFLVAENTKTRNTTFISGAKDESDESLVICAQREIKEELGLTPNSYQLKPTKVKHEFIFGPKKSERAGHKGSYQVFLAILKGTNEIKHTDELNGVKWMTKKEVINSLSFPDLIEVFEKAVKEI